MSVGRDFRRGGRLNAMIIRAAVLEEFGQPLAVQDVELREPEAFEVLVRLVACGVCHSDLYTASGVDPTGHVPTVLGHEGAGVVERVGRGVTMVRPGDHVLTMFEPECGVCADCTGKATNLCLTIRATQQQGLLPDGTTRLMRGGDPMKHFMGTSAFAEYTVMPEIALAKIDPDAPLDLACLFACGYSTGLGAAMVVADVRRGSTCVVFGAGLVGLGAIAGCRTQGAARVICVDLSPKRLELAANHGATDTVLAGSDAVGRLLEAHSGVGMDYAFEATGDVNVMRQAVECTRMGSGLCVICGVAGRGETLDVIPRLLIEGRTITGCELGGLKGRTGVAGLVDRWLDGEFDVEGLVTLRVPLERINDAIRATEEHRGLRSVVLMNEGVATAAD